MSRSHRPILLTALATAALAATLPAHDDDRKLLDRQPRFEGPVVGEHGRALALDLLGEPLLAGHMELWEGQASTASFQPRPGTALRLEGEVVGELGVALPFLLELQLSRRVRGIPADLDIDAADPPTSFRFAVDLQARDAAPREGPAGRRAEQQLGPGHGYASNP